MTPYYQDDFVTIYHGDCREVLPAVSGDVVLTDFPYGIGVDYGDSFKDTPEYLDEIIRDVLPLALAAAPVVALTSGVGNAWRYPRPTWTLCWHQSNAPTASGKWGFNMWQPVLVYGTDPYLKRGRGRRPDVISVGASGTDLVESRNSGHPCPKPLGPWKAVLNRVSPDVTDIVLDPFMGAGTTLVAAKYRGRKAIGIEIEERYCEIAAKRMGQEVLDFGGAA